MLWPLRPAESAKVSRTAHDGQVVVSIEHAPLSGVTPDMLAWWYAHVPGTMAYAGDVYPRYLVWHPLDHILYQVIRPAAGGGVGPGAQLHITEALGRDPGRLIDIRVQVEELGAAGAIIAKRVAGTHLVRLENEFAAAPEGVRYVTRMRLGDHSPLGRLALNRVATTRAFPPAKLQAWTRHHIEEIGNLEHFLPALYAERAPHES
ncbi:DAPG hydrolase family protein [Nonomuraea turcica]|uniref:DAPG hydrolase family protein n=1 Tax=Nonomuraea sp. G32 TaxID=3067274 RepID=UPI00273C9CA3|nr:hypothetical protein [Nonomuraea sp. G32]MDP4502239.1 hypothetical protein [Nonomuraea sp. G32]